MEYQLHRLDHALSTAMQEYINKVHVLQPEILQARKAILSEDMAITLLTHLSKMYVGCYSSLITSKRLNSIRWEEIVANLLEHEDWFVKGKQVKPWLASRDTVSQRAPNKHPNHNLSSKRITAHKRQTEHVIIVAKRITIGSNVLQK